MRETLLSLAAAMADPDPVKAKAAKLQMEQQVHRACAPKLPWRTRAALLKELLSLVDSRNQPRAVRAQAARLLGYAGGKGEERALAQYESDPELGEDIRMARERLRRR